MTREEFYENVTTWQDLKDFCSDEDCNLCDEIYDEYYRDRYVDDHLIEWAADDSWQDLLARLENIPTGSEFYLLDDYGDWIALDGGGRDFEEFRDSVAAWMDEGGYWDDDDEEEPIDDDEEEPIDDEEEEPIDDEDCSIVELFGGSADRIREISEQARRADKENERALQDFLSFTS